MHSSASNRHLGAAERRKSVWRKLHLLMWKNLLLRRRHWLLTSFEVLLPVLLFTLLLTIRMLPGSALVPNYVNETTTFSVATEQELREILCRKYGLWVDLTAKPFCYVPTEPRLPGGRRVFYGPPGDFAVGVARHVAEALGLREDDLQEVGSNAEMDTLVERSYFETNESRAAFYVGLFFHGLNNETSDPPEDLNYDLRLQGIWLTSSVYPFMQIPGPRYNVFANVPKSYNMDGFTLIQSIVDRYYVARLADGSDTNDRYQLQTQKYPYPPYAQDYGMSQIYGSVLPTFIVLSLVLLSPSLLKGIVYEKETGVKELARLMGLDAWLVWFGWFVHAFSVIFVVSSIVTLLLKVEVRSSEPLPPILPHTDPFFVWVLLMLYGVSSIAFCFMVSTFFNKPTLATTVGVLLWLTSFFVPRSLMTRDYDDLGLAPKLLSCLLPNMAVDWAFEVIALFEGRGIGVQWDALWETGSLRDQLTPAMILLMLVLDTALCLLVTWYADQVSPGVYGVPQRWYFPFQESYWRRGGPSGMAEGDHKGVEGQGDEYFEEEPPGLEPGIVIRNLRKEFKTLGGKVKVAVENVSMTCYEGQCTVLLGHNGAGKTTTMSILTGVHAPTAGYALVGGWNTATNLKEAREEVGLCPQHNMLFVDLTVLQHLLFFGRLKGMKTREAREEATALMERLGILQKKDMYGGQLSGGMKRKLCLAIALIGGSKVVILDEPSSGLDPESRRWVWDVVQGERGRRTFLVTTHHMEEADVLGDRVAIMASGRVVCAGSTLFLKDKFGDGYTLTATVSEGAGDAAALKEAVLRQVPSAALRSARGGEVAFRLPPDTALLAGLLDALTSLKGEIGVRHLGLSLASMEQVFLRVGEALGGSGFEPTGESPAGDPAATNWDPDEGGPEDAEADGRRRRPSSDGRTGVEAKGTGTTLLQQRFLAFLTKRAIYSKRKWVLLLSQGLLPVLVTVLCLLVDSSFDERTYQEPPVLLNLSMFPHSTSFVYADPSYGDLASAYESLFWESHKVNRTEDMESSLLEEAKNLQLYRENSVCSAEFLSNGSSTALRMLYQSIPFHTPGISTSLIGNALLRFATNSTNHSITTYNRPLPPDRSWIFNDGNTSMSSLVYSMVMPLALAFLSASFLVFPLEERVSKAKQIQVMTGASVWTLWAANFLWDFMAYMASALVVFSVIMLFDSKDYFTVGEAGGALILLLLLYGWGSIPMAYAFSFPFQTAASGFAVLALLNIFAGQIVTTAVWALDLSKERRLMVVGDALGWITSLVPTYPASMGFMHLVNTSSHNDRCSLFDNETLGDVCEVLVHLLPNNSLTQCCPQCAEAGGEGCFRKRSYFLLDESGVGRDLLTLFVNGVVFLAILVAIEAGIGRNVVLLWQRMRSSGPAVTFREGLVQDDDVAEEASKVERLLQERKGNRNFLDDSALLVSGLSKRFIGSREPAVDGISFRVCPGECVGLLGVNGAGKTTTFRMLTGDEEPSAGDATIGGASLRNTSSQFLRQIGYCPQFDAALAELTGVEMLQLMGRLRGLGEPRLREEVGALVSLAGLKECSGRPSSTYSGGNRRKLSTAMALVGSPRLVFLDEPTSGVDPASRRRVWRAVGRAVRSGRSVVLTSHSMEECEALCSRILIMSRGALRCAGTPAHLKAKFGRGYTLHLKLRSRGFRRREAAEDDLAYEAERAELMGVIGRSLSGATLVDQHQGMLSYRIPSSVSWGQLFSVMEDLKAGRRPGAAPAGGEAGGAPRASIVEVYAASDTSLEQVFLSFAREAAREGGSQSVPGSAGPSGGPLLRRGDADGGSVVITRL